MNHNHLILRNILKTQTEMLQLSRSHYEDDILPLLQSMRVDLWKKVEQIKLTGVTNKQRTDRLNVMLQQSDELIENYYLKIHKRSRKMQFESAKMTNSLFAMRFNRDLGNELFKTLNQRQLSAITKKTLYGSNTLKRTSGVWWEQQSELLKKKYREAVQVSIAEQEPIYKIVQKIRGSRANKFTDGIMKASYVQAKMIARSSIIHVSNSTRMELYQENQDIISGFKWVSTLDGRTTLLCAMLDGKVWDLEYNPIDHDFDYPGETPHFGCRSTQIPVMKPYKDMPLEKQKIIDEKGMRSSYQGYVPKDTKYSTFLRNESTEFQNQVLGQQRATLFRQGKLSLDDMISKDFEKIKLAELEKKID